MNSFVTTWQSGLPETPCGAGSMLANTELIRALLPQIVNEFEVFSIADVGCGDQNWISHVEWPHEIMYQGLDVQPRSESVAEFDVTRDVPPCVDLIMCIYVLNHLIRQSQSLKNFKESGSQYLLMSYTDSDFIPFHLIRSWFHKDTGRHVWRYGLFDLENNNEI